MALSLCHQQHRYSWATKMRHEHTGFTQGQNPAPPSGAETSAPGNWSSGRKRAEHSRGVGGRCSVPRGQRWKRGWAVRLQSLPTGGQSSPAWALPRGGMGLDAPLLSSCFSHTEYLQSQSRKLRCVTTAATGKAAGPSGRCWGPSA